MRLGLAALMVDFRDNGLGAHKKLVSLGGRGHGFDGVVETKGLEQGHSEAETQLEPLVAVASRGRSDHHGARGICLRQHKEKRRPGIRRRFRPDETTMPIDDAADRREADARAFEFVRVVQTLKHPE